MFDKSDSFKAFGIAETLNTFDTFATFHIRGRFEMFEIPGILATLENLES